MKRYFLQLFFLIVINLGLQTEVLKAQNELTISNPKVEAFTIFENYPVSHMTGAPDISIPLITVESHGYTLPIVLRYHLGTVKPPYDNTNVAVGWLVEAGGHIIQPFRHAPDKIGGRPSSSEWIDADDLNTNQYLRASYTNYPGDPHGFCPERRFLVNWESQAFDTEYDIFSFSMPGRGGEFVVEEQSGQLKPYFLSDRGLKGIMYEGATREENEIYIYDEKGFQYVFGDTRALMIPLSGSGGNKYDLTNIISPHGLDLFQFTYNDHNRGFGIQTKLLNYVINDRFEFFQCAPNNSFTGWGFQDSYFNTFVSTQTGVERVIDKITFDHGTIEFDVSNAAINTITLKDKNGNVIKEVAFQIGSFPGSAAYRRLDAVVIKDKTLGEEQRYSFDYYGKTTSIETGHIGVDEFGYFDGSTSTNPNTILNMYPRTIQVIENAHSVTCGLMNTVYNNRTFGTGRAQPNETFMKVYTLKEIVLPTKGKVQFDYDAHRYVDPYNSQEYSGGGLRVKKITSFNESGNIEQEKAYTYQPGDIRFSTKDVLNYTSTNQTVLYKVSPGPIVYSYRTRTLHNALNPRLSGNNTIFYTNVTEYNGNTTSYEGKTEFEYNFFNRDDYAFIGSMDDPYMSLTNRRGWENGRLKKRSVYKNGRAQPIMVESYSYSRPETKTFNNLHVYKVNSHGEAGNVPPNLTEQFQQFDYLNYSLYVSEVMDYLPVLAYEYQIVAGALNLSSKTTTYYYDDGTQLAQTESYSYSGNLETQPFPTSITTSRSNGDTKITSLKYPADSPTGTQMNATIFNRMISDNVIGEPVKQETKVNGTELVEGMISNYRIDEFGNLVLDNVQKLETKNNTYETRFEYDQYDSDGNLLQLTTGEDIPISYLWGYDHQYPVAKIVNAAMSFTSNTVSTSKNANATTSQSVSSQQFINSFTLDSDQTISISYQYSCSFDGFESGYEYADIYIKDSQGLTKVSKHLYSNGTVSQNLNLSAGTYSIYYTALLTRPPSCPTYVPAYMTININVEYTYEQDVSNLVYESFEEDASAITAYAKTGKRSKYGSYTISLPSYSGTYILSFYRKANAASGWVYYEVELTGQSSYSISSSGQYVDEIRFYPKGAQMTTYTYDPLIGVTSQTDPNGKTTYFEYDDFRRLKNVKDDDGNILDHTVYHFQN